MSDETQVQEKEAPAKAEAPKAEAPKAEAPKAEAPASKEAPKLAKPVLIGRKLGMLQHFKEDGSVVAATVIAAEANVVTQVRTKERDGYSAIQLGFGRAKNPDRLTKAALGHLKNLPPL